MQFCNILYDLRLNWTTWSNCHYLQGSVQHTCALTSIFFLSFFNFATKEGLLIAYSCRGGVEWDACFQFKQQWGSSLEDVSQKCSYFNTHGKTCWAWSAIISRSTLKTSTKELKNYIFHTCQHFNHPSWTCAASLSFFCALLQLISLWYRWSTETKIDSRRAKFLTN